MATYNTEDIRNIALVGQAGAGKTTLVEALLQRAGVLQQMGSVEKGTTVCDFDPQEKAYKHSFDCAVVSLDYHGGHINLVATPGYPDFLGRSLAVLPAVETCAVVISADGGIDRVTVRMMEVAKERNPQGNVTKAEIVKSGGGGFDEEALKAVKQSRFEPAQRDGQNVPAEFTYIYRFRLQR